MRKAIRFPEVPASQEASGDAGTFARTK